MIGKSSKAPCGHKGEVVVGNYVRCLEGCEGAVPEYVKPEITEKYPCKHLSTYTLNGVEKCAACDKTVRYVGSAK